VWFGYFFDIYQVEGKYGAKLARDKDIRFNALTIWEEGWHNNHHHNPRNAKFGEKWWEVDLGYLFVKLIKQ
jgi:fatty-acid desaturase